MLGAWLAGISKCKESHSGHGRYTSHTRCTCHTVPTGHARYTSHARHTHHTVHAGHTGHEAQGPAGAELPRTPSSLSSSVSVGWVVLVT